MLAILHAIPDSDNPHAIVAKLMAAMPSGSYLAISHAGSDLLGPDRLAGLEDAWGGRVRQQVTWRSREQVARFFEGTDEPAPVAGDELGCRSRTATAAGCEAVPAAGG
jgi:S-adenosyl methyltransferase